MLNIAAMKPLVHLLGVILHRSVCEKRKIISMGELKIMVPDTNEKLLQAKVCLRGV